MAGIGSSIVCSASSIPTIPAAWSSSMNTRPKAYLKPRSPRISPSIPRKECPLPQVQDFEDGKVVSDLCTETPKNVLGMELKHAGEVSRRAVVGSTGYQRLGAGAPKSAVNLIREGGLIQSLSVKPPTSNPKPESKVAPNPRKACSGRKGARA